MAGDPPSLVVDASVAVKWLLREDHRPIALLLQDRYVSGEVVLLAPLLLLLEVGNVLAKRVRRGELQPAVAQSCFAELLADAPVLVESGEIAESAFRLALAHQQPIYDCLYLALALDRRCDLITADEKFYRSLAPVYGCVRMLQQL